MGNTPVMDTCRAVVFLGNEQYEVREFPVPDPPPGGAVLQVEACGLCGSDLATFEGVELIPDASVFPVVPGHETVGRVVKLAPDATALATPYSKLPPLCRVMLPL